MHRTVKLVIAGRVQGVFFRKSTKQKAGELGVYGTVCNLDDGRVEVIAQGSLVNLEPFIAWCHQGPLLARVESVDREDFDAKAEKFDSFEII